MAPPLLRLFALMTALAGFCVQLEAKTKEIPPPPSASPSSGKPSLPRSPSEMPGKPPLPKPETPAPESAPEEPAPAAPPEELLIPSDPNVPALPAPGNPLDDLPLDPSDSLIPNPPTAPGVPDPTLPPNLPAGEGAIPESDLAPTPGKSSEFSDPSARGPIFRVKGAEAFVLARERGYLFTPAQGLGRRDGLHTVASQVPNVLTSEVHGPRMMQMRPVTNWTTPFIENVFYMFCDSSYNATRLAPGWKIRGIQLKGPDWQWVACPRSGAATVSFSVRIRAWKTDKPGTVVSLEGITLEGPPGATDWKDAFPSLVRSAATSTKERK